MEPRKSAQASTALMTDARRGHFDIVLVWRFDRFARSVKQLVLALEEFKSLHIDFVSHQEALDTSTPMGGAMFTIIAAMAELERSVIRERVVAGLDYARAHGTKSGKPVGRPRVIFRRDEVVRLRDQEHYSWSRISRELKISMGTARRVYLAAKGSGGTVRSGYRRQAEAITGRACRIMVSRETAGVAGWNEPRTRCTPTPPFAATSEWRTIRPQSES